MGARAAFASDDVKECNAPGFFPKLELLVILFIFFHRHDISIIASHILTAKIIFIKPYFIFLKLSENILTGTVVSVF